MLIEQALPFKRLGEDGPLLDAPAVTTDESVSSVSGRTLAS
jgi:hypothetical protein